MRGRPSPIDALVTLPRLNEEGERRARWRQAVTALGQQTSIDGPPPLDGADLGALVNAARVALDSGLADDLDWIAPGPAGVALYELTTALPAGNERREFGRRVFSRLYGGPAGAFASVATRMAWNSVRQLESPTMRARVGLCFSLPIGSSVNADPLALALVSRREHFQSWIAGPSGGPLPTRRLAAIILERAAREAVRRAQTGDPYPLEWLTGAAIRPVYERLLADREPLVWRHAAVARGLLSAADSHLRQELDLLLDPSLSPTEWRRAVVSLVACLGHDPDTAMQQCRKLLRGELAKKHPGLIATFLWGLGPVIESEPEVAEELLLEIAQSKRHDVAEAIASLLQDVHSPSFGLAAAEKVRENLTGQSTENDVVVRAFIAQTQRGLDRSIDDGTVSRMIHRALVAYETNGAFAAYELASEALERAHQLVTRMETQGANSKTGLIDALPLLADLDSSALERSRLYDLLLLSRRPGDNNTSVPQLENLFDRLGNWILRSEQTYSRTEEWSADAANARRRKLVTFLHLLDVQSAGRADVEESGEKVRSRIRSSIQTLLDNISEGPDASVHRVMCAALARSFDAAVRENVADASDLLLLIMDHLREHQSIRAIKEASTDLGMREGLQAYTDFLSVVLEEADRDSPLSPNAQLARAFITLSSSMGTHGTYRGEALRQCTLRIGRMLEVVAAARGITELAPEDSGSRNQLAELEKYAESLRGLAAGSTRRVLSGKGRKSALSAQGGATPLSVLMERAVSSGERASDERVRAAISDLVRDLPPPFAIAIEQVLEPLLSLALVPASDVSIIPLKTRRAALPDWLLPRRTIGGFYVVRALGAGGVSSVFLAKRIEERKDAKAESYALKVPEFDPTTARSLSEHEFMEMFRDEAGALLSLPRHINLARFVNFDLSAKPKPILVMELIVGQSLEKLIRNRSVTIPQAFKYLLGILGGLCAMHRVGVAHLDIKPSNVILRDEDTPALVDFGLSGRQLRPGCGTLEYCAPEVLGVLPEGHTPEATPADIYAFACTAFELLSGQLLFDSDDEVALMSQHVSHDGWPPGLAEMATNPDLNGIAVVLAACLRRDPRARPTAEEVSDALRAALQRLHSQSLPWPLPLFETAETISA